MDKCSLYGKVLEIKIPRPVFIDRSAQNVIDDEEQRKKEEEEKAKMEEDADLLTSKRKAAEKQKKALEPLDDPRNYDYPEGFGNAYVEFTSVVEAKRARKNIHLLRFNNRLVECEYHDEAKFALDDFRRPEPIKREIREEGFEGLENCAIEFTEARPSEPMKI